MPKRRNMPWTMPQSARRARAMHKIVTKARQMGKTEEQRLQILDKSRTQTITPAEYRFLVDSEPATARGKKHKYGAKPVEIDGHVFPSKLEAKRYGELKLLERAGEIRNLKLQPRYDLTTDGEIVGLYVADFSFDENWKRNGTGGWRGVVEDAKGMILPLYVLKRNLFKKNYPHLEHREILK